jgi:biopolymer transport protein ExbB
MTAAPMIPGNDTSTIDGTILDLMLRAGSHWVLYLMLFLSLVSVAIMIERLWFFIAERPPRDRLATALLALRNSGPKAALAKLADSRSMQAEVMRTCLARIDDGAAAVEELKLAALESERIRYERWLAILGTLGSNAPFIGLFGTVLGIIRAFHDLAASATQGTQAVMSGIAESLVATGVGLLVAIPAVAAYNAFTRRVETQSSEAEGLAHAILAHMKIEPGAEDKVAA